MLYTKLGRTGLKVSKLCLGTYNFDFMADEVESSKILSCAFEQGIIFFDTADIYGWKGKGTGSVESIIGNWFSENPGKRDQIVLTTKVFGAIGKGINENGLSAYHIRSACEASLKRLKTDHIDLYFMHHFDKATPLEEIWQAFDILIHQGKVLYVGSSNFSAWQIVEANCFAKSKNIAGIAAEQPRYNLAFRLIELELIPALRKLEIGLMPWSPLGGGLLAGTVDGIGAKQSRRMQDSKQKEFEKHKEQIDKYEKFCSEINREPSAVALAWLLNNPIVTSPIIGPRNVQQLYSSIKCLDFQLEKEEVEILNSIWPGPEHEAPEAYAMW